MPRGHAMDLTLDPTFMWPSWQLTPVAAHSLSRVKQEMQLVTDKLVTNIPLDPIS